jgi:hypothetical protein
MDIARIRFDDPEDLGDPSRIFVSLMMSFETLDYARRYFERKGDRSSMERAQEIRKLYKQTILNCVYIIRSLIPDQVMHDSCRARDKFLKEREKNGLFEF